MSGSIRRQEDRTSGRSSIYSFLVSEPTQTMPLTRREKRVALAVFASALAGLIALTAFLSSPVWRLRNRGADTTCSAFHDMSPRQRTGVINKMGYAPKYTTNAQQVADALETCKDQPGDEALEYALGP